MSWSLNPGITCVFWISTGKLVKVGPVYCVDVLDERLFEVSYDPM